MRSRLRTYEREEFIHLTLGLLTITQANNIKLQKRDK